MSYQAFIIAQISLIVGIVTGWLASERFHDFMMKSRHRYEELFKENPHPELYTDGKINRGDYLVINFEPGYDPEEYDPEDLLEEG